MSEIDVFEIIRNAKPTLDESLSRTLLIDVITNLGWTGYSSSVQEDFPKLLRRFYNSHARIPGMISQETIAVIPMHVVETPWGEDYNAKGFVYLNGAILSFTSCAATPIENLEYLFVDAKTSEFWSYPTPSQGSAS